MTAPCGWAREHPTAAGSKSAARIAYALYGRAESSRFQLSNATWLRGKPHIFIPDRPTGPWAALYKPVHRKSAFERFPTDANMLWAAHVANSTVMHSSDWLFVGDDDSMPFEREIQRQVRGLSSAEPNVLGYVGFSTPRVRLQRGSAELTRPVPCRAADVCAGGTEGDERNNSEHGCCACPTAPSANGWKVSWSKGVASYRVPPLFFYGGTGILLSRGVLDAITSADWVSCTQRMLCGPSDDRLLTCIYNLLPRVCAIHVDQNENFMRGALQRAGVPAAVWNDAVWNNALWSTMSAAPIHGIRIIAHFADSPAHCPWSMHKLDESCIQVVYNASLHCHSHAPAAHVGSQKFVTPVGRDACWWRAEQQERKRLQAKFGWGDAATAPFEELHVRSELARRNELAEKGRDACKVVVTEEQSRLACEYGVTYGCVDERTVWTRCRGQFRCGGQAHVTFRCGFPPGRPLYHCNCSSALSTLAHSVVARHSKVHKPGTLGGPFRVFFYGEPGAIAAEKAANYHVVLCIAVARERALRPENTFWAPMRHFSMLRPPVNASALSTRPVDMLYQSSNCDPQREQFAQTVRRIFEGRGLRFEHSGACKAGSSRPRYIKGQDAVLTTKMMISMSRNQRPDSEALDEKLALPMLHGAALPLYVGTGHRLAKRAGYPMHAIIDRADFNSDGEAAEAAANLAKDPAGLDERQKQVLKFEPKYGSFGGRAYVASRNFSFATKQVQVRVSNNRKSPIFLEHLHFLFGGRYDFVWGARGDVIIDQCCW